MQYFQLAFYWFSWIISYYHFEIIVIIFYCCKLVFFFEKKSFPWFSQMEAHISHPSHGAQTGCDNPAQKNTITVSLTNLTVTDTVKKCGRLYSSRI